MNSNQQRDRNGRFVKHPHSPTRIMKLEQMCSVVMIALLILGTPFLIGLLQAVMEVCCG